MEDSVKNSMEKRGGGFFRKRGLQKTRRCIKVKKKKQSNHVGQLPAKKKGGIWGREFVSLGRRGGKNGKEGVVLGLLKKQKKLGQKGVLILPGPMVVFKNENPKVKGLA